MHNTTVVISALKPIHTNTHTAGFGSAQNAMLTTHILPESKKKLTKKTIVECVNCKAADSSCMCFKCFIKSDHRGHKFVFSKSFGTAVCDCGNVDFMKASMHCPKHSLAKESIKASVSSELGESFKRELAKLLAFLVYCIIFGAKNETPFRFLSDIVGVWINFWKRLKEGCFQNQNVLLLVLDLLVDVKLLKNIFPSEIYSEIQKYITSKQEKSKKEIQITLKEVLQLTHEGRFQN